jgi:hypothetical protein
MEKIPSIVDGMSSGAEWLFRLGLGALGWSYGELDQSKGELSWTEKGRIWLQ